jgi:hypothetical protein
LDFDFPKLSNSIPAYISVGEIVVKPRWHSRVVSEVKKMAEDFNYESMYPSKIYIRAPDDRVVLYNPDTIWFSGRKGIQMVIWEVEGTTPAKSIAGDIALASLARTSFAEFYPWEDFEIGSQFKEPIKFPDIYDKRKKKTEIMRPEERRRFWGNEITRLYLFIILRDLESVSYYKRYVDILTRKKEGAKKSFDYVDSFACDAGDRKTVRSIIRKKLENIL